MPGGSRVVKGVLDLLKRSIWWEAYTEHATPNYGGNS